ncbi:MAG: DsbA family protein [Propionibacteriaceae bacterium]|nr:DsbA family protein [Propionibacteriaceae bacterium]
MSTAVTVTTFTDPMMGLSYEQEPVYRALETHFGEQLQFRYRMGLLVPDVMRLVDPHDLSLGEDEAIRRYNTRLAQVYLDEEPIGGLPIVMDDFALFSAEERSTLNLCLAYEAALIVEPERANAYLYALRFATIVMARRTTRLTVAMDVAREEGLDAGALENCVADGRAGVALADDLARARGLGIRGLPAVHVQCGERSELVHGLADRAAFVASIDRVSDGAVKPSVPDATAEGLSSLLGSHPLMSAQEITAAFDLDGIDAAEELAAPLVASGTADMVHVKDGWFLRRQPRPAQL